MTRAGMLVLLLWANFFTSALQIDLSQIKVYPKHGSISGVFHASFLGSYAFNASIAREVCERLGVTIADKVQVVHASTNGFETCRFGWIDEQIAVIPRIQSKQSCGQGGVGVLVWRAHLHQKFDVFCFNATDFEARAQVDTKQGHKKTLGTAGTHMPPSSTGGVLQLVNSTALAPSASLPDLQSTFSEPSRSLGSILNYPEDKEQALALSSTKSTIGVVPTALLITTIFIFLLAAIVAIWYFNMSKSSTVMQDGEQQEYIETEELDATEPQADMKNHSQENADVSVNMDFGKESESREAEW